MLVSTTNIYQNIKGKSPPSSHFFVDVASNQSHVRATVVLDNVLRECTFGVIAINDRKKTIPLALFEFFQISITETEWYSMKPEVIRDHTILVGPPMRHVKQVVICYRPSVTLHGDAVTLRVVCFHKGKALCFGDSPQVKISKPFPRKPLHRRVVQLQKNGLWQQQEMDAYPTLPTLDPFDIESKDSIEYLDEELGELAELDLDTDILMDDASKERIETLESEVFDNQCTILQLEEDLQKSKEKFFMTEERDDAKRCDKCYDVIEGSHYRSVFWVHEEKCFEKYHCFECEKKPKELRRRLVNWYWKDHGAHRPFDYLERAVFTTVNCRGLCDHRTLEDLADEFDKYL